MKEVVDSVRVAMGAHFFKPIREASMSTWARRVSTVLFSITLAAGASAATASHAVAAPQAPVAQAVAVQDHDVQDVEIQDVSDCTFYLYLQGYPPIPVYVDACEAGASGAFWAYVTCYTGLTSHGVIDGTADLACKLAAA